MLNAPVRRRIGAMTTSARVDRGSMVDAPSPAQAAADRPGPVAPRAQPAPATVPSVPYSARPPTGPRKPSAYPPASTTSKRGR